jgi:hypothetical protein
MPERMHYSARITRIILFLKNILVALAVPLTRIAANIDEQ